MRWKKFVGGLALSLTVATGCKQPVFMNQDDFYNSQQMAALPKDLEANPGHSSVIPDVAGKMTAKPTDVLDPDRPVRYLTLTEAYALALEKGNIGGLNAGTGTGTSDDNLVQRVGDFGAPIYQSNIRVLALEPAVFGTNIESALSRFDAAWVTSATWNTTDRPTATALDFFQSGGQLGNIATQAAELRSQLVKPLPTGGVAGITFDVPYQYTNIRNAPVNPSYTPSVQFGFEQPLLQGFGVDVNQVRAPSIFGSTPVSTGSILGFPVPTPQNSTVQGGILITRVRLDQSRAVLECQFDQMLLNVEVAYWNLYAAYGQLYAREIALRKNLEVWHLTRDRVEAGVKTYTQADLYETQGQYESSRSDWLGALGNVLETERNLRGLLGLAVEDNTRLVPTDAPTLAPVRPNWEAALQEALMLRPELAIFRENLKARQLNMLVFKNELLPDLRFAGTWDVNAIGSRLDGPDPNTNALRDLASDHFNNWSAALRLTVPLGYRDANAGLRQARLRMAEEYWALRSAEDVVQRQLALQYRHLSEFQEQIQRNLAAVEAYNNELNVRIQRVRGGTDTPDVTLQAIRFGSAAMVLYYQFVGQYNASLANFEWAKGTLLRRDNVVIADGPLPNCAQVRAVEHEEERAKGLLLRERAAPVPCDGAGCQAAPAEAAPAPSPLPKPELLSIPDWLRTRQPLPAEVNNPPASLPVPKTLDQVGQATGTTSAPAASPAPAPTPKPPPGPGSTSSFGVVKPLQFPEDMKVQGLLPPLLPANVGNGTR